MEFTAINGQLYVAIYLAEVSIVCCSATFIVFSIVIIRTTSTSEDAFTAIEFTTIDGK